MAFQALNYSAPVIPQEILEAFADQPKIKEQVAAFIGQNPYSAPVFQNISAYVLSLKRNFSASQEASLTIQPGKKRKLDAPIGSNGTDGGHSWADKSVRAAYIIPDVSVSIPVRKKMRLELVAGGLRGVNAEGEIEFGIAWDAIEQAFCLPVPEKAKRQHNFVIIPRGGEGLTPASASNPAPEPIVWTVMETGPKEEVTEPEPALTTRMLNEQLQRYSRSVTYPSDDDFASAIPPTGRPGEKSYHVKAHRGSKDGFLFFLSQGILWAFKKPLLFLPFSAVTSVSYTSVLQRTFNLIIVASDPDGNEQEIEFSMLDQADYAGIDDYVKRHGLHDASLAASRKAKVYNVNKMAEAANGAAGNTAAAEEAGVTEDDDDNDGDETELQRAERLLQDEEDELEEDYVDDEEEDDEEEGSSEDEGWEGDNVHENTAQDEEEEYDEEEE